MGDIPEWKKKLAAVRGEEPASKPGPSRARERDVAQDVEAPVRKPKKRDELPADDYDRADRATAEAATSRKSKKKGAARSETAEPYEGPSEIHEEPPAPARTDKKGRGKKQRAQVAAAAAEDAGNSSASPRKGRLKRTGTVAVRGTKALRNPRQALQLFHSSDFNVDDFIGSVYQDADDKGVQTAAQDLLHLKEHCHHEVQGLVLDNYKLFLECCKGRAVIDEAVTELRTHVQDATALIAALKDAQQVTAQQLRAPTAALAGGSNPAQSFIAATGPVAAAPEPAAAAPGASVAPPRPIADALETQLKAILLQLDVAVAEQEYSTAVSLLGLASDVLTILTRDAHVLAGEVGDVSNWRKGWETAVADHHRALVSSLESHLRRGGLPLSTIETRGAAAVLSALTGEVHAAEVLLDCHSERLAAVQQVLLRYHMSGGTGSEEDTQQFAAALCQRAFLGIASAADDVAALWGRSSAPAAALLARWAEREARNAARVMRRQALTPFLDTSSLVSTAVCIQVGLVVCGTLEVSHALSVTVPFMAELWFHMEEKLKRHLQTLATDCQQTARDETLKLLKSAANTDSGPRDSAASELPCATALVSQLKDTSQLTACFSGPKLAPGMRPGVLACLAALLDGVASALQEAAGTTPPAILARVGIGMMTHLQTLLQDNGPVVKALEPLLPACGPLVDLSELRGVVSAASDSLRAGLTAQDAAAAAPASTTRRPRITQPDPQSSAATGTQGTPTGRGRVANVSEDQSDSPMAKSNIRDLPSQRQGTNKGRVPLQRQPQPSDSEHSSSQNTDSDGETAAVPSSRQMADARSRPVDRRIASPIADKGTPRSAGRGTDGNVSRGPDSRQQERPAATGLFPAGRTSQARSKAAASETESDDGASQARAGALRRPGGPAQPGNAPGRGAGVDAQHGASRVAQERRRGGDITAGARMRPQAQSAESPSDQDSGSDVGGWRARARQRRREAQGVPALSASAQPENTPTSPPPQPARQPTQTVQNPSSLSTTPQAHTQARLSRIAARDSEEESDGDKGDGQTGGSQAVSKAAAAMVARRARLMAARGGGSDSDDAAPARAAPAASLRRAEAPVRAKAAPSMALPGQEDSGRVDVAPAQKSKRAALPRPSSSDSESADTPPARSEDPQRRQRATIPAVTSQSVRDTTLSEKPDALGPTPVGRADAIANGRARRRLPQASPDSSEAEKSGQDARGSGGVRLARPAASRQQSARLGSREGAGSSAPTGAAAASPAVARSDSTARRQQTVVAEAAPGEHGRADAARSRLAALRAAAGASDTDEISREQQPRVRRGPGAQGLLAEEARQGARAVPQSEVRPSADTQDDGVADTDVASGKRAKAPIAGRDPDKGSALARLRARAAKSSDEDGDVL